MPSDHFLRITNGREIDLAAPLVELSKQRGKPEGSILANSPSELVEGILNL
jgi:hypothetical protein